MASAVIEVNTARKRGRPSHEEEESASPTPPRNFRIDPCVDVQKDMYAHWPVKVAKRSRCKVCQVSITNTLCEKCNASTRSVTASNNFISHRNYQMFKVMLCVRQSKE